MVHMDRQLVIRFLLKLLKFIYKQKGNDGFILNVHSFIEEGEFVIYKKMQLMKKTLEVDGITQQTFPPNVRRFHDVTSLSRAN